MISQFSPRAEWASGSTSWEPARHSPSFARSPGRTVTFHGRLDDYAVTELFEACRAYCLPGREDFGISPVEAQAAGKPVIAFAGGGPLETVVNGTTGVFFHDHDVDSMVAAIARCDELDTAPEQIAASAGRFSVENFRRNLIETITTHRARWLAGEPAITA